MKSYQFASVYGPEIIDVTADSNGQVRACSKGMLWVHMMTHRYGETTITALRHALGSTHIGFEVGQPNSPDDGPSHSSVDRKDRAKVVDLNDDGRTMLRMIVTEDGQVVGYEGPFAFLAEGLNEIIGGGLGPSDVAELLDFESGIVEYKLGSCPPLPQIATMLDELLREDLGRPQSSGPSR